MGLSKITVIIPVYNTENFLKKCIDSVLSQTYSNIEIILINDGSIDNSLKICEEYKNKDSRIVLIDKKNGGVSSARNSGLNIAIGDYIGFVDSDDFIDHSMFEELINKAEKEDADIVECGYYTCDDSYNNIKENLLTNNTISGNYECCYAYLTKKNTTNFNVNKLFKANILKGIRYPNYKYSEDYWFNANVFLNCERKATLSKAYYYYVQHSNSAVNKSFEIKDKMDVFLAGEDVLFLYKEKYPELSPFVAHYICNYVLKYYYYIKINNLLVETFYLNQMKTIFKTYYLEIDKKTSFRIKVYFYLFKLDPNLFYFSKSIIEKIKSKFNKLKVN